MSVSERERWTEGPTEGGREGGRVCERERDGRRKRGREHTCSGKMSTSISRDSHGHDIHSNSSPYTTCVRGFGVAVSNFGFRVSGSTFVLIGAGDEYATLTPDPKPLLYPLPRNPQPSCGKLDFVFVGAGVRGGDAPPAKPFSDSDPQTTVFFFLTPMPRVE